MSIHSHSVLFYGACVMGILSINACHSNNLKSSGLKVFQDVSLNVGGRPILVKITEELNRSETSCSTSLKVKVRASDLGEATALVTAPFGNDDEKDTVPMSIYRSNREFFELKENATLGPNDPSPHITKIAPASEIEAKIYTNEYPRLGEIYSSDISSFYVDLSDVSTVTPLGTNEAYKIQIYVKDGKRYNSFYIQKEIPLNDMYNSVATQCLAKFGTQKFVRADGDKVDFGYPDWDKRCIAFSSDNSQIGKFLSIMEEVKKQVLIPRHQELCAGFANKQL